MPIGDASLDITVKLIDRFSQEYNRLLGKIVQGSKLINQSVGKNVAAFKHLNASLGGVGKNVAAFKHLNASLGGVGKEVTAMNKSFTAMGREATRATSRAARGAASIGVEFKRLSHTIFSIRHIFATVIAGVVVKGIAETAGAAEDLEYAFKNLATAGGMDATVALNAMRTATRGTVHDMDLMRAANNAMLLGVAKSAEDFATLAEAGRRLGKAVGRTALQGFEDLALGIGRRSRLILDNLGIIIRVEQAYRDYAAAVGKNVEELNEEDQNTAFRVAALESVRLKIASLGEDTLSTSEKFAQLWVEIKNVGVELSTALAPSLLKIGESIKDILPELKALVLEFAKWAEQAAPKALKIIGFIVTALAKLVELGFDIGQFLRSPWDTAEQENAVKLLWEEHDARAQNAKILRDLRDLFKDATIEEAIQSRNALLEEQKDITKEIAEYLAQPRFYSPVGGVGMRRDEVEDRLRAIREASIKETAILDRIIAERGFNATKALFDQLRKTLFGEKAAGLKIKVEDYIASDEWHATLVKLRDDTDFRDAWERNRRATEKFSETAISGLKQISTWSQKVIDKMTERRKKMAEEEAARLKAISILRKADVTEAEMKIAAAHGIAAEQLVEFMKKAEEAAVNWKLLARIADISGNETLRAKVIQELYNQALKEGGDTAIEASGKMVDAERKRRREVQASLQADVKAKEKEIGRLRSYLEERQKIWAELTPKAQAAIKGVGGKEQFLSWRENEMIREKTLRDLDILMKYTDQYGTLNQRVTIAAEAGWLRYSQSVGTATEMMAQAVESSLQATETFIGDMFFDALLGKMKSFRAYLLEFLKDVGRALTDMAAKMAVVGIIKGIPGAISGLFGGGGGGDLVPVTGATITPINNELVPVRQHGGPVSAGRLYRVNENVEYFRPSVSGQIMPLAPGGGRQPVVQYVTNVSPIFEIHSLDAQDTLRVIHRVAPQVARMITQEQRNDPHSRKTYGIRR